MSHAVYSNKERTVKMSKMFGEPSQFFSSPEPKSHTVSLYDETRAGVHALLRVLVRACVHNFNQEYLRDQIADRNQILSEAILG